MIRPVLLVALVSALSGPALARESIEGTLAEPELRLFGDRLVLPLLRPSTEWGKSLGLEPEKLAEDGLAISLSDVAVRTAGPEALEKILEGLKGQGEDGVRLAEHLRALSETPEVEVRLELLLKVLESQPGSEGLLKLVHQVRVKPTEVLFSLNELDPTLADRIGFPEVGDLWGVHFFPWLPPVLERLRDPDKVPQHWEMDLEQVVQKTGCLSVVPGVPTADEIYKLTATVADPFTVEIGWEGVPPNGAIPPGGSRLLYGPDEFVLQGGRAYNLPFPNLYSFWGGLNRFAHADHPLVPNQFYKYCVYSRRNGLEVARRRVDVTMPDAPPPALSLSATVLGTRAVRLNWTPPPPPMNGGLFLSRYELFRDGQKVHELTWGGSGNANLPTSYVDDPRGIRGAHNYELVAHWSWTAATSTASASITLPRLVGLADTHNHQFSNLGFGGELFHGDPRGPLSSLDECSIHGINPLDTTLSSHDFVNAGVSMGRNLPFHFRAGFPDFLEWPRYDDFTHQQVHKEWLKRAWEGGLRLMVMLAVTSEPLCEANSLLAIGPAAGRTCQDMENVLAQIDAAKQLETEIASEGGWYDVVYTAAEARDAILHGRLAVVLGLEVDQLFDCNSGNPNCSDPSFLATEVAKLRAAGIRHVFPIHLTDNAFGGAAVYNDFFNLSNRWVNGSFFGVTDCSTLPNPTSPAITFQLSGLQPNSLSQALVDGLGTGLAPAYPTSFAHCNATGLTTPGQTLLTELMRRKLIIDVDHMSDQATQATVVAAESANYPLIAGHTGFNALSISPHSSHEANLDDATLARIRALGGLVSVNIRQGAVGETAEFDAAAHGLTPVAHDCDESVTAFAQAYCHAVAQMQGLPVGIGTDFNGLNGLPPPRFGAAACKGAGPGTGPMVSYPFTDRRGVTFNRQVSGARTFDINFTGVAHAGMLPDFIQELRTVGLSDSELQPLYESADRYLEMWEKIDARP